MVPFYFANCTTNEAKLKFRSLAQIITSFPEICCYLLCH